MAISEVHKKNFETLERATKNGDIALMECTDKKTGSSVNVICAVYQNEGEYVFVPLAKLFNNNPYDELNPPV